VYGLILANDEDWTIYRPPFSGRLLLLPTCPPTCAKSLFSGHTIWIMANEEIFAYVEPDLFAVLEELRRGEPIFHTPEFGTTLEDFESATDPHG
jgi:hypothetical protein